MSAMEINSSTSCPSTPCWISERPFLTDRFHQFVQKTKWTSRFATDTKDSHTVGFQDSIGCYNAAVQAKAMAGDAAVRSLLEKMAECASNAYLGILERCWGETKNYTSPNQTCNKPTCLEQKEDYERVKVQFESLTDKLDKLTQIVQSLLPNTSDNSKARNSPSVDNIATDSSAHHDEDGTDEDGDEDVADEYDANSNEDFY